jgi:hypothetical protein
LRIETRLLLVGLLISIISAFAAKHGSPHARPNPPSTLCYEPFPLRRRGVAQHHLGGGEIRLGGGGGIRRATESGKERGRTLRRPPAH